MTAYDRLTVRADELTGNDSILLRGLMYYALRLVIKGEERTWQSANTADIAPFGTATWLGMLARDTEPWRGVYEAVTDVNQAEGEAVAFLRETLHENFVLLRLTDEGPNSAEFDDVVIALRNDELVPVQRQRVGPQAPEPVNPTRVTESVRVRASDLRSGMYAMFALWDNPHQVAYEYIDLAGEWDDIAANAKTYGMYGDGETVEGNPEKWPYRGLTHDEWLNTLSHRAVFVVTHGEDFKEEGVEFVLRRLRENDLRDVLRVTDI